MGNGTPAQTPREPDEMSGETTGADSPSQTTLTRDSLFHVLQTSRRRAAIRYLQAHLQNEGGDFESVSPVPIGDLTEWIAAREHDITVEQLRSSQRQRVYISLYQTHLPKLDELGIIYYDNDRGLVTPTPTIREFAQYLEEETPVEQEPGPGETPWVGAYVLLTAFGAVLLALTASDILPIEPLTVGGLIVGGLGVITAAYTYDLSKREQ